MPGYSVTISAVDRATPTIDRVNSALNAVGMRAASVVPRLDTMGASLSRFNQRTGITTLAADMGNLAHRAASVAASMGRFAPALAGLAGLASAAGIAGLVNRWTDFSTKLGNDAGRIGVTAQRLHGLQGAARLAGSSAEGLSDGMETLGANLVDAVGGRSPATIQMLSSLGIAFQDARTGGARLADDVLPEVADRIAKLRNPFLQARAATALFGGAGRDLLPFLSRGAAGIRELTAISERYGVVNDAGVAGARDLAAAQARMSLAAEGMGYAISQRVAPVLVPMLNRVSDWIAGHRDEVASFLARTAKGIEAWVGGGGLARFLERMQRVAGFADAVGHGARAAVDAGGKLPPTDDLGRPIPLDDTPRQSAAGPNWWQRNMPTWLGGDDVSKPGEYRYSTPQERIRAGVMMGTNSPPLPTAEQERRGRVARDMLVDMGWTPAQAAGIVANLHQESGFNERAIGDGGAAYGIAQHHADRRGLIQQGFGVNMVGASFEDQVRAVNWELSHTERAAGDAIRATRTAAEAGAATSRFYERPANRDGEAASRAANAVQWAQRLGAVAPVAPVPPAPPVDPVPVPVASAGAPGANGTAVVRLEHFNPPAGLTTSVRTEGDVHYGGLRIERQQIGSAP